MKAEPLDIDAIVREVLAKLVATAKPSAPSAIAPSVPAVASVPATPIATTVVHTPVATDLVLVESVVTVALLAARVSSTTRRLVVAPRAVVTPSARDWLRTRSIELARTSLAVGAAAKPTAVGKFYLHSTLPNSPARAWSQRIVDAGWELENLVPCPVAQAAAELSAVLGQRNRLGLLLTRETTAAVCLTNRHDNVRAAEVSNVETARAAVQQIHANLLIVEPSRCGEFGLRRIVQEYLRVGPRDAPAKWRGES